MAMPPRNNLKEDSSSPPGLQTKPRSSPKHSPHVPFPSSSSPSSSAADNFSRDPGTKPIVFPPGYKFVPNDEDLILHYLKPFLRSNKNPPPNVPIHRVNIYESNPERLSKVYKKGNDKEWFFITERTKMLEGGKKHNRSDNGGFWKTLLAPKKIKTGEVVVGYKTTLDYNVGKYSHGVKSDWIMHEYWTESSSQEKSNGDNKKVDHVLCKIFLTPSASKRKAEEEENEKRKRNETSEEEVEQPCNLAFQQPQRIRFSSHELIYSRNTLAGDRESNNSSYLKKSPKRK